MEVSVAMAVYNGAEFLEKQLYSLYQQTHEIDELIACDDGSEDDSQMIFDNFVKNYGLEGKWRFVKNPVNKGFVKNFLDCASMCTKDIIFFSDQDDIWDKKKIEKMLNVFQEHEDAKAVCCSIKCIDKYDNSCNTWINIIKAGFGGVKKISFEKQVRSMTSSGLTLAVRKEILNSTKEIIEKYGLHYDSPFGLIYAAKGEFYRIYQPLVFHRIHDSNTGNPSYSLRTRKLENHIGSRENQCRILEMIQVEYKDELTESQRCALKTEIRARRNAILYMKSQKTWPLLLQTFRVGSMDNKAIDIVNFLMIAKTRIKKKSYRAG